MIGDIVMCVKGYETEEYFYVIGEEDQTLFLVNGKRRTLEKPKRKKMKHTVTCGVFDHEVTGRLQRGEPLCNRDLRRALAAFRDSRRQTMKRPGR